MAFKSQGEAVKAAFALITGSAFSAPVVLEADVRAKIGEQLLKWFNEGEWSIKSDRCNKGDGLLAYIGGDAKKSMKCNIIDNFLTRLPDSKKAPAAAAANDPLSTIKAALAAGLITPDQAAAAALKLIVG